MIALVTVGRAGVRRHAQLRRIVQRLVDRQLRVDDVLLRHIAHVVAKQVKVAIQVNVVDVHRAVRGRAKAVDGIHQRGLARAAHADQRDELLRQDRKRNVLQQVLVFGHPLVQPHHVQPQPFFAELLDAVLAQRQLHRADADFVAFLQPRLALDALAVDEHAVGTLQVADAVARAHPLDERVVAAHLRVIQHDAVIRRAANGDGLHAFEVEESRQPGVRSPRARLRQAHLAAGRRRGLTSAGKKPMQARNCNATSFPPMVITSPSASKRCGTRRPLNVRPLALPWSTMVNAPPACVICA